MREFGRGEKGLLFILGYIAITAMLFGGLLISLSLLFQKPLTEDGSFTYSLFEMTIGLSVTAVASVVALLLAIRAIKSSEQEKTIALLEIYQPEISELFNLLNERQLLLGKFLEESVNLSEKAQHVTNCLFYDAFINGSDSSEIFRAFENRKEELRRQVVEESKKHGLDESEQLMYFEVRNDGADFFVSRAARDGDSDFTDEAWLSNVYDLDIAMHAFQEVYQEVASLFKELCLETISPDSGLYHRVISGSFDSITNKDIEARDSHLFPPHVAEIGGEFFNSRWPKISLSDNQYIVLSNLFELFENYEPVHFLKASRLNENFIDKRKLKAEFFHRKIKNIAGFNHRGAETPEDLGRLLGRFMPVVCGYGRESTIESTALTEKLDDLISSESEKFVTFSRAGSTLAGCYPCSSTSNYYSTVFDWIIPMYIRVFSPESCIASLKHVLATLDLDGDLLDSHLHVQGTSLFTLEAFGNTRLEGEKVSTIEVRTASEIANDAKFTKTMI